MSKPAEQSVDKIEAKINLDKAIKMKFVNGNTDEEIGAQFGVTRQAVNKALKPFKEIMKDNGTLQVFTDNYSDILAHTTMNMVQGLNSPDKLEAASLNNLAYAFTAVNNAKRLEDDKSSMNVSVNAVVDSLQKDADSIRKARESILNSAD